MYAARPARQPIEVIDLVSDSEEEQHTPPPPPVVPPPQPARQATPNFFNAPEVPLHDQAAPGLGIYNDGFRDWGFGDDVLDNPWADDNFNFADGVAFDDPLLEAALPQLPANNLFGLAGDGSVDLDEHTAAEQVQRDYEIAVAINEENSFANNEQTFDPNTCLQRVLELFPDIKHEYVLELWEESQASSDVVPAVARLEAVIERLLSGPSYPKEERIKSPLKRKRQTSVEADKQRWEFDERDGNIANGTIRRILKAEFSEFPQAEVNQVQAEKLTLYKSYVHMALLSDTGTSVRRGRPTHVLYDADTLARTALMHDELEAARKRVKSDREQRADQMAKKAIEDENLQRAIEAGETAECQACFDDLPMNRQIHCSGATPHFTCYECAETYIKSEIGESRCRVMCTAGCGSGFAPNQLNLLSDKDLLEKLAQLQQEKDIRDAGLDDLEECPFCDYKAILPPIEEDFEFRCANPQCEKVSCRRCKALSHIPFSCEQHAKDNAVNSRHKIEEAMTAAMIRSCNKCKKTFIKDYGCNKMTCPSCGNLQCYVCSESLKDYNHFDQRSQGGPNAAGKCPLYDNVEERHEREVKAAEEAAKAEILASNPDISQDDLKINVSDAVKQATEQRRRAAGPAGIGGGGGAAWDDAMAMLGGLEGFGRIGVARPPGRVLGRENAADRNAAVRARRAAVRQRLDNVQRLREQRARFLLAQQARQAQVQPQPQAQAPMQQPYGFQNFAGLVDNAPQYPRQYGPAPPNPYAMYQPRRANQIQPLDPAPAVAPPFIPLGQAQPQPQNLGIYRNGYGDPAPAPPPRHPLDAQWPPGADHLNNNPWRPAPVVQRGVNVRQARRRDS